MTYGIVKEWTEYGLECTAWYKAQNASNKLVRWEFTDPRLAWEYSDRLTDGAGTDAAYSVRALGGQYAT